MRNLNPKPEFRILNPFRYPGVASPQVSKHTAQQIHHNRLSPSCCSSFLQDFCTVYVSRAKRCPRHPRLQHCQYLTHFIPEFELYVRFNLKPLSAATFTTCPWIGPTSRLVAVARALSLAHALWLQMSNSLTHLQLKTLGLSIGALQRATVCVNRATGTSKGAALADSTYFCELTRCRLRIHRV